VSVILMPFLAPATSVRNRIVSIWWAILGLNQ
jgi:hypothetical protein